MLHSSPCSLPACLEPVCVQKYATCSCIGHDVTSWVEISSLEQAFESGCYSSVLLRSDFELAGVSCVPCSSASESPRSTADLFSDLDLLIAPSGRPSDSSTPSSNTASAATLSFASIVGLYPPKGG